ncbi:MAG: TonB-dependent receptor [Bacteroidetes bacterium]|nr:TonB-dependent receptor [Bacteroidota bacterium]
MKYHNILREFMIILTLFFSINVWAISFTETEEYRTRVISGRVINVDTKEPLIGVNISVKKTNIGTSTDESGYFTIKSAPVTDIELNISIVGYKSIVAQIPAGGKNMENLVLELKEGTIEMGTVVVTGTNSPRLYEDSPVKTEIIPNILIRQQNAYNLAQALGLQTGVSVENDCNNCNFTQVRILGFEGKYTQILIDGDPVISSLGGVYGLEHYPKEMIEQIEIVKGGGSALYGGDAIAGTINLITRKPAFNRSRISYFGGSVGNSYDQQISATAEMVNKDNTSGFFAYGSTRSRNPYDRNGDGFSELGELKNETIGFDWYSNPFESSDLQISFHRIFEERRGGENFDRPVHEAGIAEWIQHFKYGGKIKWSHKLSPVFEYRINYAFSLLRRNSYYGGLSDTTVEARLQALNYYGFSNNPLHTGGIQLNYISGSHSFTGGVQYDNDRIDDKSVSNSAYFVEETFKNLGVFVQDEFLIEELNSLQVVAGIRFDQHSALDNWIISPRLNLSYELTKGLKLRAGYTTGFKAPQIFDEDLHICGLEGTQRVIRNSPGLKEERSNSFTVGAEFQNFVNGIPLLLGVTGFYTKLDGAYTNRFISSSGTIEYWERINSIGADVKGIEVDFGIKPFNNLELRTGITLKESNYKDFLTDFDTKNFLRTPNSFGYLRSTYNFTSEFNVFFSMKYTGKMDVPHEIVVERQDEPLLVLSKSQNFFEFDFSARYKFELFSDLSATVTTGIKNLTNAYQKDLDYGIKRDPGYVYGPSSPRTYFVSLELNM